MKSFASDSNEPILVDIEVWQISCACHTAVRLTLHWNTFCKGYWSREEMFSLPFKKERLDCSLAFRWWSCLVQAPKAFRCVRNISNVKRSESETNMWRHWKRFCSAEVVMMMCVWVIDVSVMNIGVFKVSQDYDVYIDVKGVTELDQISVKQYVCRLIPW